MTIQFKWSKRSIDNFKNVHPDLIEVANRALELSEIDFVITDGGRTLAEQKHFVAIGASQTMNSNHLIKGGYAYAIDFAPFFGKSAQPKAPLQQYKHIADAFKKAAKQLGIKIVWGGDWKSFVDGCHIELDRKAYPR